jgi:hypothetical protein
VCLPPFAPPHGKAKHKLNIFKTCSTHTVVDCSIHNEEFDASGGHEALACVVICNYACRIKIIGNANLECTEIICSSNKTSKGVIVTLEIKLSV